MARPIGTEDRAEDEPTPPRPYRQEIIVPEVSRAGTYRTEPAVDHDFATPEEIEA